MNKFFKKGIILGICLALLGLVSSPQADAAFSLRLSSGADVATITDDDISNLPYTGGVANVNDASPGLPGFMSVVVTVGNFTISGTFASSDPVLPNTQFQADLHLTNLSISSALGGTITIELTDTGFTLGPPFGPALLKSGIGGTQAMNSTVEAWQVLDLQNAEFAANVDGEAVIHHGPMSSVGGGAFASPFPGGFITDEFSLPASPNNVFSITERVVITHAGAGSTSFDMHSTAIVPVPPTIFLCLSGLPMLASSWWLRRCAAAKKAA